MLHLAVIGAGPRSRIAHHAGGDDVEVSAVVDPDERARSEASSTFGAPGYADVDALLASGTPVDAALVATPDHTHVEVASRLLEAGVAVYLEKPLAISTDAADELLRTAFETRTKLYVGHNMRHMAVVRLMHDIIARGEIGEVRAIWCRHFVGHGGDFYFKDWHARREYSHTLLLQKGAHDIDVIHWLAGASSTRVSGMANLSVYNRVADRHDNSDRRMPDWFSRENWPPLSQRELSPVIDVEDLSMVQMELSSGVLASYQQCHYTPDYWRNYTVIGTEGRLENFGDTDGGVVRVWNRRHDYAPTGDVEYPIVGDAGGHGDADRATMAEFLDFVRSDASARTSPLAARNAVAVGDLAARSARTGGGAVEIPPVLDDLAGYFDAGQPGAWPGPAAARGDGADESTLAPAGAPSSETRRNDAQHGRSTHARHAHGHDAHDPHEHPHVHSGRSTHAEAARAQDARGQWEQRYAETAHVWSGRANAALVAAVGTLTPGRALDVGCGEGADVRWLADQGWDAQGIDLSATAIRRARATHAVQPAAHFDEGDVRSWNANANADAAAGSGSGSGSVYDLVAASFLHSTDDRVEALRAAAALVAPGGRLLVISHAQMPPWAARHHPEHAHGELTPQQERAAMGLGPEWNEAEISEIRERVATGPDGEEATLRDSVLMLRRR